MSTVYPRNLSLVIMALLIISTSLVFPFKIVMAQSAIRNPVIDMCNTCSSKEILENSVSGSESYKIQSMLSQTTPLTSTDEFNPPVTNDDYDGFWHNSDFTITLSATDDYSGVLETY